MARVPTILADPVLNVGIFWGVGAPASDYLPGVGSEYRNLSTGDVYTLNGSNAWVQMGTSAGGAADWSNITNKPTTIAGYGITDAFTQTAADARYWTQAQADGRFLKLTGGTLTGGLTGPTLTLSTALYGPGNGAGFILARNAANSAYVDLLYMNATDGAVIPRALNVTGNLTVGDVHASRTSTTGALYLGSDGQGWLFRSAANMLQFHLMHLGLDDGYGMYSNVYGAQWKFATGGPQYMDFLSGDATSAGIRIWYNGTIAGYLYTNSAGFGLLNDAGGWALRTNKNAIGGGTLFGTWTQDGVTLAKVVYSSAAPTSSDNYPDGTIWIVR